MKISVSRVLVPFGHTDPTVQPCAQIFLGASYLPGLQAALHAVQDADGYLLGLRVQPGFQDRLSAAMAAHRDAALHLSRILRAGGVA